jgi:hypothetical protein
MRLRTRRSIPPRRGPRSRPALIALVMTALAVNGVAAQVLRTLSPGTRVRVRLVEAPSSIVAEIVGTKPDTLILGRPSSPIPSTIPLAVTQIETLEISDGRRQLTIPGVLIGIAVGVAAVSSYNAIVQSQCFSDCPSRTNLLVGGAGGGLAGGIGFTFIRSERWVRVALPRRPTRPGGRP